MRRAALALAAAGLIVASLAGCNPSGQPCNRAGDVKVYQGESHRCVQKRGGLVWS